MSLNSRQPISIAILSNIMYNLTRVISIVSKLKFDETIPNRNFTRGDTAAKCCYRLAAFFLSCG